MMVTSKYGSIDSSNLARSMRFFKVSSFSVFLFFNLFSNSSIFGGFMKIAKAFSPKIFFNFIPPFTSTSNIGYLPSAIILSISVFKVPVE